jgi:hypothetical protein
MTSATTRPASGAGAQRVEGRGSGFPANRTMRSPADRHFSVTARRPDRARAREVCGSPTCDLKRPEADQAADGEGTGGPDGHP